MTIEDPDIAAMQFIGMVKQLHCMPEMFSFTNTASSLNQTLVFLENDFGLLVFIRSVDGYAIGISRC